LKNAHFFRPLEKQLNGFFTVNFFDILAFLFRAILPNSMLGFYFSLPMADDFGL